MSVHPSNWFHDTVSALTYSMAHRTPRLRNFAAAYRPTMALEEGRRRSACITHLSMAARIYFDITKEQRELNWQPRFSTDQMFAQSYDWHLANRGAVLRSGGTSHYRSAVTGNSLAREAFV